LRAVVVADEVGSVAGEADTLGGTEPDNVTFWPKRTFELLARMPRALVDAAGADEDEYVWQVVQASWARPSALWLLGGVLPAGICGAA
jgi:hypothetical protein